MKKQEIDLNKMLIEGEQKRKEEIKDLESRSNNLYELLVEEDFNVNEVIAETYAISFTQYPDLILSSERPLVYHGGFTSRLVLKVTPENKDTPIRTLNFEGFSPVKAGDYISAQILRYKEEKVSSGFYSGPFDKERVFYFDREFNQEESAIELTLISAKWKVLRIDRAVDYQKFIKK